MRGGLALVRVAGGAFLVAFDFGEDRRYFDGDVGAGDGEGVLDGVEHGAGAGGVGDAAPGVDDPCGLNA